MRKRNKVLGTAEAMKEGGGAGHGVAAEEEGVAAEGKEVAAEEGGVQGVKGDRVGGEEQRDRVFY